MVTRYMLRSERVRRRLGSFPSVKGFPASSLGNTNARHATMANDTIPTVRNVARHPMARPSMRPHGRPKIIATDVPIPTMESASEAFEEGATRTASGVMIDQNTA